MQINLYKWELKQAIADYCKKKHGMFFDAKNISYLEHKYLDVQTVYKKYKNGKVVKNKHGVPKIDWENSPTITSSVIFSEGSSITLFLGGLEEEI